MLLCCYFSAQFYQGHFHSFFCLKSPDMFLFWTYFCKHLCLDGGLSRVQTEQCELWGWNMLSFICVRVMTLPVQGKESMYPGVCIGKAHLNTFPPIWGSRCVPDVFRQIINKPGTKTGALLYYPHLLYHLQKWVNMLTDYLYSSSVRHLYWSRYLMIHIMCFAHLLNWGTFSVKGTSSESIYLYRSTHSEIFFSKAISVKLEIRT